MGCAADVRVAVLGPLRLVVGGQAVEVPGPKRRAVLALLAKAEGHAVTVDQLLYAVWPSEPPDAARVTLHSVISRLRGHLGPAAPRLETMTGAYRLELGDSGLDAAQARALLRRAQDLAGREPAAALALLRKAKALWRGPVLADLQAIAPIAAWSLVLDELRRNVLDLLVACAIDANEADDVVALAAEAAESDPLREPAVVLLMRALAATGQAAEALRVGHDYRRRLRDEAGLDPSPALGELERRIAGGQRAPAVPRLTTRLVGRDAEVSAVRRLLEDERLVTVLGPGGVGKSRISLEVARRVDTATVLLLAPVTDPAAVPHALAAALDLRIERGDVLGACAALLAAGPGLLVVDNCEHLLDAVRDMVSILIGACPQLTVLATSREPLGLDAESRCRIAPLGRAAAVEVFLDRAGRVRPGFAPGAQELRLVGDLVQRLDGMPLAIELAAGRLSSIDLCDLHARLDRALDLLGQRRGPAHERHRTLRATIEWSYALLPEEGRRLFRHLSVFPDGFDLGTAERVATDSGILADPAEVLGHLVDASMVEVELDGRPRYRILETLRAFGRDRLVAAQEDRQATERLVRWACDRAAWIDATMATAGEPEADEFLRREFATLRAAWHLTRQRSRVEDAIGLVRALFDAAGWRDLTEVWAWADELAADPAIDGHPRAATVLGIAANFAWTRGAPADANRLARRGLTLATDHEGRWSCLSGLALADLSRADFPSAIVHATEAAVLAPRPDQNYGVAAAAAAYAGDLDQARTLNGRLATVAASPTLLGLHEYVAAEIDNAAGRPELAERHYRRAIDLARSSGATFLNGIASVGLVTVLAAAGRVHDALRGYRDLIDYWERTGSWIQQWTTLRNLARLLHALGDPEPASYLEAAADRAPDAPAVGSIIRNQPVMLGSPAPPAPSPRAVVLEVARRALERHAS